MKSYCFDAAPHRNVCQATTAKCIGLASEAGHAVQEGTCAVITLMAASPHLGILTLMPIPILDGGNILLLALEASAAATSA